MTLMISLPPDVEQALRDRAARQGQTLEAYLERLAVQEAGSATGNGRDWQAKLDVIARLQPGWNGHNAPSPSSAAIGAARSFLGGLTSGEQQPSRLTASAVGGVAVTFRRGERKVMIEFLNSGQAHAQFADDATQVMDTRPVVDDRSSFLTDAWSYLNG